MEIKSAVDLTLHTKILDGVHEDCAELFNFLKDSNLGTTLCEFVEDNETLQQIYLFTDKGPKILVNNILYHLFVEDLVTESYVGVVLEL